MGRSSSSSVSSSSSSSSAGDRPAHHFYTPEEIASHNTPESCWVSLLGKVYDLTDLIAETPGNLVRPLLEMAGQDISHWFDAETQDIRMHVDPVTWIQTPYVPQGRFLHVPPNEPASDWPTDFGLAWWKNPHYCIGAVSRKVRKLRIINTLTHDEHTLDVCAEESLSDVRLRYMTYNRHAASYTWKRLGQVLDMSKTLDENGIVDESEDFYELNLDEDFYVPAVHLYFDDDLTVA